MSKLKFKMPLLFLLLFPILFSMLWVYEAHLNKLPVIEVFNNYLQDKGLMKLLGQMSLASFFTSFVTSNYFKDFDALDFHAQRLIFVFVFALNVFLIEAIVWLFWSVLN